MASISVPMEIVNKLINIGGLQRKLQCLSCKEYTEHVQVSRAEGKHRTFDQIAGRIIDLVPLLPLLPGNPFACTKCGRIRNEGGILSDICNR